MVQRIFQRLGGNTMVAVSLAATKAATSLYDMPLQIHGRGKNRQTQRTHPHRGKHVPSCYG